MSETKPHVSPSQLNLYSNCGEAYRRRYIEGEIIPPGVAAHRGRAVHGAGEVNHKQKRTSRTDLPVSDLVDVAASSFEESVRRDGYVLTPDEASVGATLVVGAAKDSAVRLTRLYADWVAPAIMPDLVEERIEIELPDAPANMVGVIDVTTEDRVIKDIKTAARRKAQSEADSSMQLTWYSLGYQAATGHPAAGVDLEVLVDTKRPDHQQLRSTRTPRDFQVLVNRINAMLRGVHAGIFPPANPAHWMCSPKWCGYFATCPYVNAERRSAA